MNKILPAQERRIYSQIGEDGIIAYLASITAAPTYYLELGAGTGAQCNCRALRECGWTGLFVDRAHANPALGLVRCWLTAKNVLSFISAHKIPIELGVLSIDVDGIDWYLLALILAHYHPVVIVAEYNASCGPTTDQIIAYHDDFVWDRKTAYFGASFEAMRQLLELRNYTVVYCESKGVNLFAVSTDYQFPTGTFVPSRRKWAYQPSKRLWLTSTQAWSVVHSIKQDS